MKKYNAIVVFDDSMGQILMCRRNKEPYKGKLNFVGGKIENDESSESAAYRELNEETGIKKDDIEITRLMDLTFHKTNCYVEYFVGKLNKSVVLEEEENQLIWIDVSREFSDLSIFAGDGDIAYIMQYIEIIGTQNIFDI